MPNDSGSIVVTRAEELNHTGAQFFHKGQMEPARLHFLAALALEPNNPRALQNLGATLRNLRHFEAAASVARRSVVVSNNNPMCRSNLGVSLLQLRKFDEAMEIIKSVVDELPQHGGAWHNYGLILYMLGQYDEALAVFDKGISLTPNNAQMQSDRALCLLSMQRVQEGLKAYEVRWEMLKRNRIWTLGIAEWQGQDLRGKSILVHHEQGFGDSIMLVRFLRELAQKGCYITLAVPLELVRLFARSFNNVKVVDIEDEKLESTKSFDYHSPMLSTMRWLNTEISAEPYLKTKPLQGLNLPYAKLKVGVCWASGNHGLAVADRRRVVPIAQFLPMSEIPGVLLVALQKGSESSDIVANGMEGIVFDLMPKLEDFAATADVMAHLDVIVSVDSAVAHLAGAIGKPCLMLAPFSRCWRWWNTNGMPWYSQMGQFVQSKDGTWDAAMRALTEDIEYAAGK